MASRDQGVMFTVTGAELLDSTGSLVGDDTAALLVKFPASLAVAVIVTVALEPAAREGRTVGPDEPSNPVP